MCWPRLAGEDTWEGRALGWDPPHEVETWAWLISSEEGVLKEVFSPPSGAEKGKGPGVESLAVLMWGSLLLVLSLYFPRCKWE